MSTYKFGIISSKSFCISTWWSIVTINVALSIYSIPGIQERLKSWGRAASVHWWLHLRIAMGLLLTSLEKFFGQKLKEIPAWKFHAYVQGQEVYEWVRWGMSFEGKQVFAPLQDSGQAKGGLRSLFGLKKIHLTPRALKGLLWKAQWFSGP